jgi:signal transduction histidine kinase
MRTTPKTLRSRIVFYVCGYLAVLLIVYSAGISGMLKISEDLAFNRQLSETADRVARHVEEHGEIPAHLPFHISAYIDISNVPQPLKAFVTHRSPGVFEVADDTDYHAAIIPILSTGQKLFVFYDVSSIEINDWFEYYIIIALIGIGAGIFILGWLLTRSLSNHILNPLSELAEAVQSISPDEPARELSSFSSPDEIGMLSEKINQLLKRISDFTRREREFTSHASHELRTPVSVIKTAVEVLRRRTRESDSGIVQPLARIERSVTDIEMLINTFLMLARQGDSTDSDEASDLKRVTEHVVETYRYLLESKPVEVNILAPDAVCIKAPESLVTIALGNLVRNAFAYTMEGSVEIIVSPDRISVSDSGPGMDDTGRKSGIGLTIVQRLCNRMNWQFTISGTPGKGARAELIFSC